MLKTVAALAVLFITAQPSMAANLVKGAQAVGRAIRNVGRGTVSQGADDVAARTRTTTPRVGYRPQQTHSPVFVMCQTCRGAGRVVMYNAYGSPVVSLCPACGGTGGYWQQ